MYFIASFNAKLRTLPALVLTGAIAAAAEGQVTPIDFQRVIIDGSGPSDMHVKAVGDFDADGNPDLLVAGTGGEIVVYDFPDWTPRVIATSGGGWSTDAEAGDVDGDGDEELVISDWYQNARIVWFENLDGEGGSWAMHVIGSPRAHDIELADLDLDSRLDIVTRDQSAGSGAGGEVEIWRQTSTGGWQHRTLNLASQPGGEGLEVADINGDGLADIVTQRYWYQNPGDVINGNWAEHQYASSYNWPRSNVSVGDINGDGLPDIAATPAENAGQFYRTSWFAAPADPTDTWTEHIIENNVEAVTHSLALADMDMNGSLDVVTAEMHQGANPDQVRVYLNANDAGTQWMKLVAGTTGSHAIRLADVDRDGDMDIFGANWTASNAVDVFMNQSDPANCVKADMNDDGVVDGADVAPFTSLLISGDGSDRDRCAGDLETEPDGVIDMDDVDSFVDCVLTGGC